MYAAPLYLLFCLFCLWLWGHHPQHPTNPVDLNVDFFMWTQNKKLLHTHKRIAVFAEQPEPMLGADFFRYVFNGQKIVDVIHPIEGAPNPLPMLGNRAVDCTLEVK